MTVGNSNTPQQSGEMPANPCCFAGCCHPKPLADTQHPNPVILDLSVYVCPEEHHNG